MASRKVDFALQVVSLSTQIAETMDELDSLAGIWTASGYGAAGADPITDDDLSGHDLTAAQLATFATFVTNYLKFMQNQAPAQANYRDQLNSMRSL